MEKVINIKGKGDIHYWISAPNEFKQTLVFLPGLTADHRLFDAQIEYFSKEYRTLVWDAPAHNLSQPWTLDFSLMDLAEYLHTILQKEKIDKPVIIGQSLGGYIAQCFMEKYKTNLAGFISIDSAPLQRKYMNSIEIWMLKHTKALFKCFSWKYLIKAVCSVCAVTDKARKLMRTMMLSYSKTEYIELSAHGYKILAEAIEADLPYLLNSPSLLICGTNDNAGAVKTYNKAWSKNEQLTLHWIEKAGHNSNSDRPDEINSIIVDFLNKL